MARLRIDSKIVAPVWISMAVAIGSESSMNATACTCDESRADTHRKVIHTSRTIDSAFDRVTYVAVAVGANRYVKMLVGR
jgi:hypothetical protein